MLVIVSQHLKFVVFKSEFESIVPEYNLDTCDEKGDHYLLFGMSSEPLVCPLTYEL